jgi:hypothetical protein
MVISAVVAFLFGLGFIIAPVAVMKFYGVTLDVSGEFIGRYLGASFIGLAFLAWEFRNAAASRERRAVLLALFITTVLGFVVALYDKFAGVGNALVWSTVVIYLLLALGFGYFSFMKTD